MVAVVVVADDDANADDDAFVRVRVVGEFTTRGGAEGEGEGEEGCAVEEEE